MQGRLGTRYVVRSGDTLWDLAAQFLGDGQKWPLIYRHNNSPQVTAATGTRIGDPDLIFVGQEIYVPDGSEQAISVDPPSAPPEMRPGPETGRRRAHRQVYLPAFKYSLPDLPAQHVVSPAYVATIKLKGSITIQSEQPIELLKLTDEGIVLSAKREADLVLEKLLTENKVGWNPQTRQVTFENSITIKSNSRLAPAVATSMGVSSTTRLPVFKVSFTAPPMRGRLAQHVYQTSDLGIEIEITPRPPEMRPGPETRPAPRGVTGWDYLIAAGLIVAAGIVIAAILADDLVPGGQLDDPLGFAAASALFVAGVGRVKKVEQGTVRVEGAGPVRR